MIHQAKKNKCFKSLLIIFEKKEALLHPDNSVSKTTLNAKNSITIKVCQ